MQPSKVVSVIACENPVKDDQTGAVKACGAWVVIYQRTELPHCPKCKKPQRMWRLVSQPEIDARDQVILRNIERLGLRAPGAHLGATES